MSEPPIRHLFFLFPARKLSLVGDLPGANVKSYAGYFTVNKKYNSNLFFWFFPALMVGSNVSFTAGAFHITELHYSQCSSLGEDHKEETEILR